MINFNLHFKFKFNKHTSNFEAPVPKITNNLLRSLKYTVSKEVKRIV